MRRCEVERPDAKMLISFHFINLSVFLRFFTLLLLAYNSLSSIHSRYLDGGMNGRKGIGMFVFSDGQAAPPVFS